MTDNIRGRCANCGRPWKVPASKRGRKAKCECGAVFEITDDKPDAPAPTIAELLDEPHVSRRGDKPADITGADVIAVASKHDKIIMVGLSVLVLVAFAGGLALGLNIHPPDQHEYDRGVEDGVTAGIAKGYEHGTNDGFKTGNAEGYAAGRAAYEKEVEAELRNLADAAVTYKQNAEQALSDAASIASEECEKKVREQSQRTVKQKDDECIAKLAFRDLQCDQRVAAASKAAYDKGRFEAGYDDWRKEGIAEGLEKGRHEAEVACRDRIAAAERAAAADATVRADAEGHARGKKEGEQIGRRKGYEEGHRKGHDDGYKKGYKDGYNVATGGRR